MLIDNMLVPALPHLVDEGKNYEETCSLSYAMTGKKRPRKLEVQYQKIGLIFVLFINLFINLFICLFISFQFRLVRGGHFASPANKSMD